MLATKKVEFDEADARGGAAQRFLDGDADARIGDQAPKFAADGIRRLVAGGLHRRQHRQARAHRADDQVDGVGKALREAQQVTRARHADELPRHHERQPEGGDHGHHEAEMEEEADQHEAEECRAAAQQRHASAA